MPVLTSQFLYAVRRRLRRLLPACKASHIAEAVAASMGFNTSIALQTALAAGTLDCKALPSRFTARLRELSPRTDPDVAGQAFETAWRESDDTQPNLVLDDISMLGYLPGQFSDRGALLARDVSQCIIIGPTGAGKSMSMNLVSGMLREQMASYQIRLADTGNS